MLAFQGSWLLLVFPFFCSGGKKGEKNKIVLTFLEISRLGLFPAQTQAARRSRGAVCPMSRIWRDWWPERPHDMIYCHKSFFYSHITEWMEIFEKRGWNYGHLCLLGPCIGHNYSCRDDCQILSLLWRMYKECCLPLNFFVCKINLLLVLFWQTTKTRNYGD